MNIFLDQTLLFNKILPAFGFKKPKIISTKVVFPDPDLPRIPMISPILISRGEHSLILLGHVQHN